jgi:hypothetical protein
MASSACERGVRYHAAVQRRHHYEQALEEWLRASRVPYVAVDEARKALVPDGGGPRSRKDGAPALKSFDLVLYGEEMNLLGEVKGRRVGGPRPAVVHSPGDGGEPRVRRAPARSRRLECWATREDVESLLAWEKLFGEGFRAAFLFVYWCEEQPPAPLFEEIFAFRDRWYAVRMVLAADYARAMRVRSERWGTVHLAGADFQRLSRPFFARPRGGTPAVNAGGGRLDAALQPCGPAVASAVEKTLF